MAALPAWEDRPRTIAVHHAPSPAAPWFTSTVA
jgi:hypothetical protein